MQLLRQLIEQSVNPLDGLLQLLQVLFVQLELAFQLAKFLLAFPLAGLLQKNAQGIDEGRFARAGFAIEGDSELGPFGILFQLGELRPEFALFLAQPLARIALRLLQERVVRRCAQ
ncbi:MAG: hypothetical protein ACN6OP_20090 [Pseudomonadales bacterium]